MKYIKTVFFIFLFLLSSFPSHAEEKNHLRLCIDSEASDVTNAYFKFLQVVYRELGYSLELKKFPLRRTFINVNEGLMDGLLLTTPAALKEYNNIVLVPFPLTHIDISVFSKNKDFKVYGRKSLEPYRIAIVRGYVLTEKLTEGLDRQIVNSYTSLFSMLNANRVDAVLAIKRESKRFLKKHLEYEGIHVLEPPFFSLPLYHCLNKKHEKLAEKAAPVIKQMIEEKVLQEIYRPYEI